MNDIFKAKDLTTIEREVKREAEYKREGSITLKKGLTMFKFNMETNDIDRLDIKRRISIGMDGNIIRNAKAQHEPGCCYIQAVNLKNARRKADKILEKIKKENDKRNNG